MLDAVLRFAPAIALLIASVLVYVLWRRAAAGRVSTARAAGLSVALVAVLAAAALGPLIVFQGLSSSSGAYRAWAWGVLLVGAFASGVLFVRAVVGDRSRGRRRCPKCWYDMGATTGLVCPECGHDAKRESRLFLARRRFRFVAASLLPLIVGASLYGAWLSRQNNWAGALPTLVLIGMSPGADLSGELGDELNSRLNIHRHGEPVFGWRQWLQAHVSGLTLRVRDNPHAVIFHAEVLAALERDTPRTTARVIALRMSTEPGVAHNCAGVLARLRGDPTAAENALVDMVQRHSDSRIREHAVSMLALLKVFHRGGTAPPSIAAFATGKFATPHSVDLLGLYAPSNELRGVLLAMRAKYPDGWPSAHAVAALANLYPADPDVHAMILENLKVPTSVGVQRMTLVALVDSDHWNDVVPEMAAARTAIYITDIRRAIIDVLGTSPDLTFVENWLLRHPAFSESERAEVKRLFEAVPASSGGGG